MNPKQLNQFTTNFSGLMRIRSSTAKDAVQVIDALATRGKSQFNILSRKAKRHLIFGKEA